MERQFIIIAVVLVWAVCIFMNFTWMTALKDKRGWFDLEKMGNNDSEGTAILFILSIILAPLFFVFLVLVTYIPPSSNWVKTKILKII